MRGAHRMRGASRRGEWHSTRFRWLSLREELRKGEAARENVVETAGSGPEVLYLSIYLAGLCSSYFESYLLVSQRGYKLLPPLALRSVGRLGR